jgi:hypothetical protein
VLLSPLAGDDAVEIGWHLSPDYWARAMPLRPAAERRAAPRLLTGVAVLAGVLAAVAAFAQVARAHPASTADHTGAFSPLLAATR